jgi:hypothetical protein
MHHDETIPKAVNKSFEAYAQTHNLCDQFSHLSRRKLQAQGNGSPRKPKKKSAGDRCLSSTLTMNVDETIRRKRRTWHAHTPGISNKEIPKENAPPLHNFGRKAPLGTIPIYGTEPE